MNFDKLFAWVVGIVIAFASVGKLEVLQNWIWPAQAKVIYESRTSTWGSPRFFSTQTRVRIFNSGTEFTDVVKESHPMHEYDQPF